MSEVVLQVARDFGCFRIASHEQKRKETCVGDCSNRHYAELNDNSAIGHRVLISMLC